MHDVVVVQSPPPPAPAPPPPPPPPSTTLENFPRNTYKHGFTFHPHAETLHILSWFAVSVLCRTPLLFHQLLRLLFRCIRLGRLVQIL
jgi:hypothetical protein